MLLDGEPIIDLPPKSVILQKVEFSDEERSFYAKLEADSRAQFKVCSHCRRKILSANFLCTFFNQKSFVLLCLVIFMP